MTPNPLQGTNRTVWISMMAALIAVGAYLSVPMVPVPLSLQTFFVLLTGFILGPTSGALAVALYLLAGLIGLPVFSGGESGLAKLLGPTGGFLLGFVTVAAIGGLATRERSEGEGFELLTWKSGLIYGAIALTSVYVLGVPWLKHVAEITWERAFYLGMLPFLPGALVKLVLAVGTYRYLQSRKLLPAA